jgi:anti-sigma regulatory factor (Ser/Thr protein kinase)
VADASLDGAATIRLRPSIDAPHVARQFALHWCPWVEGERRRDLELVVQELVLNAVVHARTEIEVTIERDGDDVRVGVTDCAESVPFINKQPSPQGGLGLQMVTRLSKHCEVARRADGKTVWAVV